MVLAEVEMDKRQCDVAVIGGGAAGLSAALALGRSRRSVIVLDDGRPRNAPAAGMHNFLSRDGVPPAELLAAGRCEVEAYGGVIVAASATSARRDGDGFYGFAVTTGDGGEVRARRLVVCTGLVDELPDVPGVPELWGSDVVHCPYCHGWEHADEAIGVLGSGPMAVHQALLFRQLSKDLVLFRHTAPPLAAEEAEQLEALGVRVVAGPVERLEAAGGRLSGVRMRDGAFFARDAVAVGPRMVARSGVLAGLGLEAVPHALGSAFGEFIESDPTGRTAVPGVWVAGNVTDLQAHVIAAAAQGTTAGAAVNADLVSEDARRAVSAARRVCRSGRASRLGLCGRDWRDLSASVRALVLRQGPSSPMLGGEPHGEGGLQPWHDLGQIGVRSPRDTQGQSHRTVRLQDQLGR
jgi:thioredoxin reductase